MMEIKGYNTNQGYMGYVNGEYRLFSCEQDYIEYMEDEEEDKSPVDFYCYQ